MTTKHWTESDIPDQTGRVAVVTGSNTGLGYDTARALALKGATVVIAVRDMAKGSVAAERITAIDPKADVHVQSLDLGSLDSVRSAAHQLNENYAHIDLLINNAGVMVPPRATTADGFELQLGTNHLGHFALTGLLIEKMISVHDSRVVVVSSIGHKLGGAIHFDDLQWERSYNRAAAYAQSKLANLLFCYELQRRLAASGSSTIAVAAHPGFTNSELMRHVWKPVAPLVTLAGPLIGQSPALGALPQLRAATDPIVAGGQYWGPDGFAELGGHPVLVDSSKRSHDAAVGRRLWAVSENLTGVTFFDA